MNVNLKEHHVCEKDYDWNTATCSFEEGKHSGSIIDDSVIMRDEIINAAKIVSKNINSSMSSIKKCY